MSAGRKKQETEDPPRTSESLRATIDSGKTHDKVAGSDPAAAPLGTDEEAAGTSTNSKMWQEAIAAERRPVGEPPSQGVKATITKRSWSGVFASIYLLVTGLIVIAMVVWLSLI